MTDMAPPVALSEVEWRIDSAPFPKDQGHVARYVPYLNAAIVAQLFDQWVGAYGWQDDYQPGTLNGREVLWCHITVFTDTGTVTKKDVGVPPPGDEADLADKGLVSDAFKRCATLKWGVGRNVYRLPTLWAPCELDSKGRARAPRNILEVLLKQLREQGWKPDGTR